MLNNICTHAHIPLNFTVTANAAAKMFDDMMQESQLSLEQALSPENHVVITRKDMQAHEERKGTFKISSELSKRLDDLLT